MLPWKLGGEVGSTSLPGGNQVDGLPPASSDQNIFEAGIEVYRNSTER